MPSDNSQVHPAGKDAVKRDYYGSTTVTKQKVRKNKIILTLIYTVCNLYTTRFGWSLMKMLHSDIKHHPIIAWLCLSNVILLLNPDSKVWF